MRIIKFNLGVLALILMLSFSMLVLILILFKDKPTIEYKTEFNLEITSIKRNKGFIFFKDSIPISEAAVIKTSSEKHIYLKDIMPPYRLKKQKYSELLTVIKGIDTLKFIIPGLKVVK